MLAHPEQSLAQVAVHFGYTQPWLSCVIHSDIFQAALAEKQDIIFHHTVMPIRKKMEMVAHAALDKIMERLPHESEITPLTKTAEAVLERLGFSSKTPSGNVNVHVAPGATA